ncbi:MAG: SDR family NAD(P)-dependent oxidoreductase [Lentisphaerae bacterium]|jgi:NAD(P)-dependent dehydrogenase (short-subunit alcohol dehydrogenase family)|nr:SDR family NAD(P)-dependent oxidoreductase [Lentisphaerota bacterium]
MNELDKDFDKYGSIVNLVSPAIRTLFTNKGLGHVTFSEGSSIDKSDNKIPYSDEIECIYTELENLSKNGICPKSLFIEKIGCFSISENSKQNSRLEGRVCIVTGAAQGFGKGIAEGLAEAGGFLVIADLNDALAQEVADELNKKHGEGTASTIKVDVGSEDSVREMCEKTVEVFGGIDLLVSNAGVLRAGGLDEMTLADFDFVTRINYTGFFLATKYASRPMKIQARFNSEYYADIVQINSKSGLEGSNRNFAYAGGKFGGIGLVQSFAKELVESSVKVNAICPGNYYEGPLWSDPEKGLFTQYLKAGKVPGAETVEDVYESYVSKVPMRRGCSPEDVTKAILYCVEQIYETGQAIPVTGGQNMLK